MEELFSKIYEEDNLDVYELAKYSDNRIVEECNKIYKKEKNKGIAFPTSISLNDCAGNYRYEKGNDKYNILSHLIHCHGEITVPLLYGLCKIDDVPITTEMIDSLKDQTGLHPFNMFIASKKVNNKISEILFDVLFKFYNHYVYLFQTIEIHTGQKRILDFLAERILHIIYKNIEYFIPGTKVYEIGIINLPH